MIMAMMIVNETHRPVTTAQPTISKTIISVIAIGYVENRPDGDDLEENQYEPV